MTPPSIAYFNTEYFPKDNLTKHITTELDKVDVWLKHNELSLNVEKTKYMIFHTCQKKMNCYNSQWMDNL